MTGRLSMRTQVPIHDLLQYISSTRQIVFHGSSRPFDVLTPMSANDASKDFGNRVAVYASSDPVIAMFYAIQNRLNIRGIVIAELSRQRRSGIRTYKFAMPSQALKTRPWTQGYVYLLANDGFVQGRDDLNNALDEWCCFAPVEPVARVVIEPADFPFLSAVQQSD